MIRLSSGPLVACFAPDAGLVGTSLTFDGVELLGQRGGLGDWAAHGKTFGIPLLHPFANRLSDWGYGDVVLRRDSAVVKADGNGLPIHGVLHADAHWTVAETSTDRFRAELNFDRPEWLAAFPFPHRLEISAALDDNGLTLVTALAATGDVGVPVSFGWHPYLTVEGVPLVDWEIETSVRARVLLDSFGIPTDKVIDEPVQPGPIGERWFDHLYEQAEGAWFVLVGGGRRVDVRFGEGYTHAQLFVEQVKGLLAFEPMTAPVNALRTGDGLRVVAPGESFRAEFRIGVTGT